MQANQALLLPMAEWAPPTAGTCSVEETHDGVVLKATQTQVRQGAEAEHLMP